MNDSLKVVAWSFLSLVLAFAIVFVIFRRSFPRRLDDALVDVGGVKFIGFEALLGTAITIVLFGLITSHRALQNDSIESMKIETMLRWHPSFELERTPIRGKTAVVANLLANPALFAANSELLEMVAETAVSLTNRHCATASSIRKWWLVTFALVALFMFLSLLHVVVMARRSCGLRVLLVWALLTCVLAVAYNVNTLVQFEANRLTHGTCSVAIGDP